MSTFFLFIFIYFTNLYQLLGGGLIPCGLGIIVIFPIYYFFRKYDISLEYKSVAIANHVKEAGILMDEKSKLHSKNADLMKENDSLEVDLLSRCDEIKKQNEKIDELNKV